MNTLDELKSKVKERPRVLKIKLESGREVETKVCDNFQLKFLFMYNKIKEWEVIV